MTHAGKIPWAVPVAVILATGPVTAATLIPVPLGTTQDGSRVRLTTMTSRRGVIVKFMS